MADKRHLDARHPVAQRSFAQVIPVAADLDKEATLSNINGVIEQIEIEVGTFTNGVETVEVNIASDQNAALFNESGLADATTHLKQALSHKATQDADFNPALVNGDLTLTVTASGDPGTTTGTVDVTIFYR